jgi:hypothetical protein
MLYKIMLLVAGGFIGGVLLVGCYKNVTIVEVQGEEITRPVSFVNDIMPIFNKSCNGSGCHNAGGKAPVLVPANAYNNLSNYINTNEPKNSELYLWMAGKRGTPMPLTGPVKDYNALILAWIKQGAQNN